MGASFTLMDGSNSFIRSRRSVVSGTTNHIARRNNNIVSEQKLKIQAYLFTQIVSRKCKLLRVFRKKTVSFGIYTKDRITLLSGNEY